MIDGIPFRPQSASTLLAAARQGDVAAFDALYRDLHPIVVRYLQAQEPATAEDLARDARRKVRRRLGQFRGDDTELSAFVLSVAHRLVVECRRQRSVHEAAGIRRDRERAAGVAASTKADAQRALAVLPTGQADVVLLSLVGSLEVDQIARILCASPRSVRDSQQRALHRLARAG